MTAFTHAADSSSLNETMDLGDILESNDDKSAEIFKIDIEGGEHSVLIPFLQEYRVCQV